MVTVGELAEAIMSLSQVRMDGRMDFGYTDMYSRALGCAEADVEGMFEDAVALLVDDGRIESDGYDYYDKEQAEAYHEADEDTEQARLDEAQSYWHSVWRS